MWRPKRGLSTRTWPSIEGSCYRGQGRVCSSRVGRLVEAKKTTRRKSQLAFGFVNAAYLKADDGSRS